MSIATFDIEVPRNGDWRRRMSVVAEESDAPVDLTGATIELSVKMRAGDPDPPVATAAIVITNPVGGIFEVHLAGGQFGDVPGVQEIVRMAYDLKVTQAGDDNIIARGAIILSPGVS